MSTSRGLMIENLSKTFTGQRALRDLSADFPAGTVTALVGQNGSGKSTLIKVLAGFHDPDAGAHLRLDDDVLPVPMTAKSARRHGIHFVHQNLALVDELTVADNFAFEDSFLTRGVFAPISRRREFARVRKVLADLELEIDPGVVVGELSPSKKTMVAIARAVQHRPRVLVLDEPTATLPAEESGIVLDLVRRIRDTGASVIYVSHRIDEVFAIADRLVALRNGSVVAQCAITEVTPAETVSLIVGDLAATAWVKHKVRADVVLRLEGVSGALLRSLSLEVRAGEILGLGGLVGCGRSELSRIVAGVQRPSEGSMSLDGAPFAPRHPADAISRGVANVPQDRRRDGCIPTLSFEENLTLGSVGEFFRGGALRRGPERKTALAAGREFRVDPNLPKRLVEQFSGGNQQKIVLAKAVRRGPSVLVLDEPMQGVDVGAKAELAQIIRKLAADGAAVIVGSTDVEDLAGLCDRVVILNRGRHVDTICGEAISKQSLTRSITDSAKRTVRVA